MKKSNYIKKHFLINFACWRHVQHFILKCLSRFCLLQTFKELNLYCWTKIMIFRFFWNKLTISFNNFMIFIFSKPSWCLNKHGHVQRLLPWKRTYWPISELCQIDSGHHKESFITLVKKFQLLPRQVQLSLSTRIRLWISKSFIFIIITCFYFYVLSQSTFSDQIRPRLSLVCFNYVAKVDITMNGTKSESYICPFFFILWGCLR